MAGALRYNIVVDEGDFFLNMQYSAFA